MTEGGWKTPRREIVAHTSIRGVAAAMVALAHMMRGFGVEPGPGPLGGLLLNFHVFVDLFFVLSGFVLSYAYLATFERGIARDRVLAFLARRFARIAPLHYLTLAAALVLYALRGDLGHYGPADLAANVAMVQAWLPVLQSYNPPAWSISVEWGAYLLFPGLAWLLARRGGGWLLGLLAVAAYAVLFGVFGSMVYDAQSLMIRGAGGFLTGMVAWRVWVALGDVATPVLGLAQGLATAAILAVVMADLPHLLLPPAFAILIVSTADDRGPVAAVLRARPLHVLGLWSYSIYLTHYLLIGYLWAVRTRIGLDLPDEAWVAISAVVTLAVSAVTYRLVEIGAKRRLTGWLLSRLTRDARIA